MRALRRRGAHASGMWRGAPVATASRQEYSIGVRAIVTLAVASGLAAAVLGGCGDGDGGAAKSSSFTVWAFEEGSGVGVAPEIPLGGAEVAFDPPGGGARVITRAAADGHATFEAAFGDGDGARGASITIYDERHVLVSAVDVSPAGARARPNGAGKPASDLVLYAPALDDVVRASSIELRGALTGKRDVATSIDVSVSGVPRLGAHESKDPSYVLRAPRDRAFFLLGHEVATVTPAPKLFTEVVGSFRVDFPAMGGDGTRDIDVTTSRLPLRIVHVRAEVPAGPRGTFGAGTSAFATVESADSELLVAPLHKATPTRDGRAFELELSVATTDIAPERPFTRASFVAPDGARSVRFEPGVVADGATWNDFLTPAFVAAAASPPALSEPLPLDDFPPGADLLVEVYAGTQLAWSITGPPGGLRGPITLPVPLEIRLPALVAVSISARTELLTRTTRGDLYRRVATTRDVLYRR